VRDLLVLAKSKKIAVVSHRGVMRVVLQKLHGCSEQEAFDLTSSYCCWFTCSAVKEVVRL
jgi:broad specificity phosphatase PhoE